MQTCFSPPLYVAMSFNEQIVYACMHVATLVLLPKFLQSALFPEASFCRLSEIQNRVLDGP